MRYLAGVSLVAALVLAAPGAHAFTMGDEVGTTTPAPKNGAGATNNSAPKKDAKTKDNSVPANNPVPTRNYGSTLTSPGPGWSLGDAIATTPAATSSEPAGQKPGFSFHTGPQSGGVGSMRPPAWSMDPLYREKGQ